MQAWLAGLGVRDPERGCRDLARPDPAGRGRSRCRTSPGSPSSSTRFLPRCPDPGWRWRTSSGSWPRCPGSSSTLARAGRRHPDDRDPASALQHQPVLQRGPDPRPRRCSTGCGRAPSGRDREALIDDLWKTLAATGRRERAVAGPPAVPPARDPPDRLQRHRPRASRWR